MKQARYISQHFNFPDHNVTHLRVQIIDAADNCNTLNELEQYWIKKLHTEQPNSLNVAPNNSGRITYSSAFILP